jgi:hypothetical protein
MYKERKPALGWYVIVYTYFFTYPFHTDPRIESNLQTLGQITYPQDFCHSNTVLLTPTNKSMCTTLISIYLSIN